MTQVVAHFTRLLATCLLLAVCGACTSTVYVRAPAICPRDTECLTIDEPNVSQESARDRERELVRRVVTSTVTVRGLRYDGGKGKSVNIGTGTVVGGKRYVLTEFQTIHGAEIVTVALRVPTQDGRFVESQEMLATPLISSASAGVTLLFINSSDSLPLPLAVRHDKVLVGDRIWFVGEHGPLSQGVIVKNEIRFNDHPDFADAELVTQPTDTGAPVLNACGEIVGIALGPYGDNGRLRLMPIEVALQALGVTKADLR